MPSFRLLDEMSVTAQRFPSLSKARLSGLAKPDWAPAVAKIASANPCDGVSWEISVIYTLSPKNSLCSVLVVRAV